MAKTAFFEVLSYRTPTTGSTPAVSCHANGLQVVLKSHHQSIHSSVQLFGVLGTNHQSGFLDFLCLLGPQVELYHILLIGICSMRPHILLQELTVESSESLSWWERASTSQLAPQLFNILLFLCKELLLFRWLLAEHSPVQLVFLLLSLKVLLQFGNHVTIKVTGYRTPSYVLTRIATYPST